MRWFGCLLMVLVGCRGEEVTPRSADDSAIDDTATSDALVDAPATDTETPNDASGSDASPSSDASATETATGSCGDYRAGTTKMVSLGDYCIDEHEVTNGQWKAFNADAMRASYAPTHCDWNTLAGPGDSDPMIDAYPRGLVNFCDAKTYCAWAGKRLCGKIGGGMNARYDLADATKSQWYRACSGAASSKYPYGNTYDETKCATASTSGLPVRPKSYTQCRGVAPPYDAVYDLSGNKDEWEDSCASENAGEETLCRGRGGAIGDFDATSCDVSREAAAKSRFAGLGFRCCKDL